MPGPPPFPTLGGYSASPQLAGSAPAALVHFRSRGGSPGVASHTGALPGGSPVGALGRQAYPHTYHHPGAADGSSIGSLVAAAGEALSGGGASDEHEMQDAAPQVGKEG